MVNLQKPKSKAYITICFLLLPVIVFAQAYQGYTLWAPHNTKYTYLTNMDNTVYKTWTHTVNGGYSQYLMSDGSLYRSAVTGTSFNGGGATGMIEKWSWSGTRTWAFTYSNTSYRLHHDFCVMPNGNILAIAWELKSAAQCVAAGLNHSASLWPDHIIEIQPVGTTGGNIVWEWHFWDHLIQDYDATKANYGVVANHPELLDINVGSTSGDWMHCNGISYNPGLDQIVFSSHNLNEVFVIDHSTTTAEAAGHTGGNSGKGGDILYRWGKPANYRAAGTTVFNVVHCAVWIPAGYPGAGNIMAFNNRSGTNSSIVTEIVPPHDTANIYNYYLAPGSAYGPASPVWTYSASGFYSQHLGGNQRLPNGNTLMCASTTGYMVEVNSAGTIVWSYNRGGEVVRALRYPFNYVTGVENNTPNIIPTTTELSQVYPNPFNPSTNISYKIAKSSNVSIKIFNIVGQEIRTLADNIWHDAGYHKMQWDSRNNNNEIVPSGVYFVRLETPGFSQTQKIILSK